MKKIHLISLGCAKNLVDSELMLGRLHQAGWEITLKPAEADAIVVNTCSFIESAVDESIDAILEASSFKKQGACSQLIVTGCLPERYREKIVTALPEVDLFLGTGAFDQIDRVLGNANLDHRCLLRDPNEVSLQRSGELRISTSPSLSYVKIAEGCNRHCSYCIIPKLRGRQRSRPLKDIVAEARTLIGAGVKELVLVAQDTTAYGRDLNPPSNFTQLLDRIAAAAETAWVRFLYGHPQSLDESVVRTVAGYTNICPYFDVPIQHASNRILKRMGRRYNEGDLKRLFEMIRNLLPSAALRTTVIVGFPGETDQDFKQLMAFIRAIGFDHLGVFVYSDSEDIPSHRLKNHVPVKLAQKRRDRLMQVQAKISRQNNQKHIGKTYRVIIEESVEQGIYSGRTVFQAPEVDGVTYVHAEKLVIGSFCNVKMNEAFEYDLVGERI